MKNYYGKDSKDFTDVERQLLQADTLLVTSIRMNLNGEALYGFGICLGTDEDVEMRFARRYELVCCILGLKDPESEEEASVIEEYVNETPYNLDTFTKDYLANEREIFEAMETKRMEVMN